ncbi:hypothetical protein [Fusobacterium sp.]|uniref:hypothetical protein n=1 Tax=Fusobacterium sp. TaxID=68766 RepID=UPI00260297C3|nr:hypothetical protein [Fusobacterium sp.]
MTLEEIIEFNAMPITEEQLEDLKNSDLVEDVQDNGDAPMYPNLTWYILTLVNGKEINVFV